MSQPWLQQCFPSHVQILLDSFHRWTGSQLVERSGDVIEDARRVFLAPSVIVSHNTQADPILNFGNQRALDLWEMPLEMLLQTPSRMTAEPMHRDERAQLLKRTTENGYVDDYQGIRIASSGKRFLIEQATVWNLVDEDKLVGQAATFDSWKYLDDLASN